MEAAGREWVVEGVARLEGLAREVEEACQGANQSSVPCRPYYRTEREYTRLLRQRNRQLARARGTGGAPLPLAD